MKKEKLDKESNSYVFNKAYKMYLEGRGINCAFCKYHYSENEERKASRSWKLKTKKRRQWMKNSKGDNARSWHFRHSDKNSNFGWRFYVDNMNKMDYPELQRKNKISYGEYVKNFLN